LITPRRILIIGPGHPLRGGLATYNERLCREFINLGHSCQILSFSLQYPSILFPGKSQFSNDPKPSDIIIRSEINSINPANWIIVGSKIAKENYDIVIFRYWMSFMAPAFGTIAKLIRKNGNTKILAITDNVIPHERRFFDKVFTSYFINSCHAFLSMSRDVLDQINTLQPEKPKVYVAHPMYDMFGPLIEKDEAKAALGLDKNVNYLLFFGFIRKYKGLKLLLESFADKRIEAKPIKLIIAGEFYEDSKPYLDLIEELGIGNKLELRTDFIPNSEVSKYFSACDMVVQTYLSATQSGVTQIAYFYSKPMLVTDVGGLAELVPHREVGYVCEIKKEDISESILDFYENNREESFVQNIHKEREKFTWSYLCQQIFNCINRV